MSDKFVEVEPLRFTDPVTQQTPICCAINEHGFLFMRSHIYSYAEARALRDWLTLALGDKGGQS